MQRNWANAGLKTTLARPCRYNDGSTSAICGDLRAHARKLARGEPLPLARGLVDTLIIDPGLAHRTAPIAEVTSRVLAVADHQPLSVLVDLIGVRVDVGLRTILDGFEHGRTFPNRRANSGR